MKYISRRDWGARAPRRVVKGNMSHKSSGHWNGPTLKINGSTTWDHKYCNSIVRGIQNFHMDGRGWNDIAYNFLECPHGYTYEGRGLNVWNGANGTNTGNRNAHAICFLAGEGNPFPESEKQGFKEAVKYIADNTSAPNVANGHRDHKATACPGNARYNWIHAGMPVKNVYQPPTIETGDDEKVWEYLIKRSYKDARGNDYDVESRDPDGFTNWIVAVAKQETAKDRMVQVNTCRYLLGMEQNKAIPAY